MADADEPLDNGSFETYTLDVEQADARLIITREGRTILVDADEDQVAEAIETVFDGRDVERSAEGTIPIDLFVTTHIDQDHVGGIESLLENNYKIQNVVEPANRRFETYTPGVDTPKGRVSEFTMGMYENGLEKHDIDTISQMSTGDTLPTDLNIDTQVLSPPSKEEEPTREDEEIEFSRREDGYNVTFGSSRANENGVVFKIEDEHSALFMGDVQNKTNHHAESWLIEQHDDPESEVDVNADVLFVGHHGSDNATSQEFLERVDPSTAVISSDLGEQFDHPRDKVIKNLHEHDVDVYWTAGHGTVRTDLDKRHATEQTTGLETTTAADLAALKHYCKENETDAEDVEILAADELSEDTPDWVAEAAPMVAETTQEMVDTAITNADTVAEVRQTLDDHPAATEHLREIVQTDRDEYVTTQTDVRENRQAYRDAQQAQAAAQPSRGDRMRAALPLVSDPDLPEYDGPVPEEIEGPFTEDAIPSAVTDNETAATIRDDTWNKSPPDYLVAAEEQANTAVETAENAEELCEGLRGNPGAHKDVTKAMETPYTHLPPSLVNNERETTRELSADLSQDEDRGQSIGW